MSVAIVTGSGGLIGSTAVKFLIEKGMTVFGVDNNMRQYFFGPEASTEWRVQELTDASKKYIHRSIDIRDAEATRNLVAELGSDLKLIVHAAAQPSHDWAAREPLTDFQVNAQGTMNLLEATRNHASKAAFVFLSTNKVYGDTPNRLPLVELETRWEVDPSHPYAAKGIDESMNVDYCTHSLFGVSKLSADLLVQEYGRYFGMNTVCFRGGCLTGGGHSAAELHGFLSYLMKCTLTGRPYTVFGYKGKQVRDNIHAVDLVEAIWQYANAPRPAAVYNIGGSRFSNCSMLEAIALCEQATGRKLNWTYADDNRIGDHIWWISDISRFQADYPEYQQRYNMQSVIDDIHNLGAARWGTRN
ncbi:MAG: SDR family NAD(P)-dependent oxidoreductase [Planctomycetota bacterium]|nr:SDR family NAD(P)-dependent oxidoreductase [Planctomycetota bacterium]